VLEAAAWRWLLEGELTGANPIAASCSRAQCHEQRDNGQPDYEDEGKEHERAT